MSVDFLKKFPLDDVRKARIDFTSVGTICASEFVQSSLDVQCTVLQSDKIRFGDKSTTGSPISSHRGSSVHHDSGSSSSGSPMASPISYTQDLIGVDSPGLSGGAGSMTPVKKEQISSLVPRQVAAKPEDLRPRSVVINGDSHKLQQPPPLPPRKSRFDLKPEDVERERMEKEKSMQAETRLLPSGKRKASSDSEEDTKSDEKKTKDGDEIVDTRKSVGSSVKRIKLETLSTTVTKPAELTAANSLSPLPSPPSLVAKAAAKPPPPPPLIPRSVTAASAAVRVGPATPPLKRPREEKKEEESDSSDDDGDYNIGPLLGPKLPKTNGVAKPTLNGSSTTLISSTASTTLISAATTGAAGSVTVTKANRKRLLSERGEKELTYPVMEKEISSKWGWDGASWLGERKRGTGLINRANDCFLNVILQMITHTAPLARYLVERHRVDCRRDQGACVACSLRDNHLNKTFRMQVPMETRWIGSHLRRIFPSHSFGMQEDAHELLSLLLDAIDPPPGWNRENGNKELPTNKLKPSTPIEQIFGGTLRNQVTCQSCSTPYINYERIRELNVALGRKQEDRIPLTSLVQDYFRNETIAAFSCKKCARKTQAVRQTRVLRAPAVLIVQLKRFNAYGGKIRQPVGAEKELDLSRFTYDASMGGGEMGESVKTAYTLTGVVEHLGSTVDHGHYVAYVRSVDNQCWFKFDDEDVSRLSNYTSNPYLLFYSRKDLRPAPKNGGTNGVTSSMASTSHPTLVKNTIKISNGNGGGAMNGMRPVQNGGGYSQNGSNGGGYSKPYQNGVHTSKLYNNQNGNGYSNKFNHNGYNKPYNQPYSNNNKWNNGGRPIKTFNKQYTWNNHQRI
ncbi:hypothetical protein PFISCL1PPCAC_26123 [Pristionchus fissidentatus]|uniref:Ubiquitin carboxyl-terminal hydrolase n=1 Tax=Pristionchus fissidentatus TaxID=1538716 RepID=A0AAV5WS25_9BILA|nr:hypothetical protein PFISCL1PPCAC_26123 [Pristionchus fissidentatus]